MLVTSPPVLNVKFNEYSNAQWALLCALRGKMFSGGCANRITQHMVHALEIFNEM